MNKVVITGANGFIGQYLKQYLIDKAIDPISLSIRYGDEIILPDCETVIHLSGLAHDVKKKSKIEDYLNSNYRLTVELFEKFLESESKCFVYVSSIKAGSVSINSNNSLSEIAEIDSPYGLSKLKAEQHLRSYKGNKKVIILRPSLVYGPNLKGNLKVLNNLIRMGIPYPFGKFKNKRSYLYIENFCFVIQKIIINNSLKSDIYCISDNKSISTLDLVKSIGKEINKPARIINFPLSFIKVFAKMGDYLPIFINSEKLEKLLGNSEVSNQKLIEDLGEPLPFEIEEGIKQTFKIY